MREQFVEREPQPCRRYRGDGLGLGRMMQDFERLAETGKTRRFGAGVCEPIRQFRSRVKAAPMIFAKARGARPSVRPIDRLDQRHRREAFGIDDAVGMHHLAVSLPKLELAGNEAPFPYRQALFDPGRIGEKKDEKHIAGLVSTKTLCGARERGGGMRCSTTLASIITI